MPHPHRSPEDWALLKTVQTERDRLRMDNMTLRAALFAEAAARKAAERAASLLLGLIVLAFAAGAWSIWK